MEVLRLSDKAIDAKLLVVKALNRGHQVSSHCSISKPWKLTNVIVGLFKL